MPNCLYFHNQNHSQENSLKYLLRSENVFINSCDNSEELLTKLYRMEGDMVIIDHTISIAQFKSLIEDFKIKMINIPIILITACPVDEDDLHKQYDKITILRHPYTYRQLLNKISPKNDNEINSDRRTNNILKYEDIILDLHARNVIRNKNHYPLRNKEFCLLKCLMEHKNKVMSRMDLLDSIWDRNANILTNTIDVHINNLRNKIDKNYSRKMIKTVHSVGYMFG